MNRIAFIRRTRTATGKHTKARPLLEPLEHRTVLSSYTAATVADLIADINLANQAGGSNTITLTAGKNFTLTALNNDTDFGNGLPVIAANNNLTIVGNGDTIARRTVSGTDDFRLFDVAPGASLTLGNSTLKGGRALGPLGGFAEGGAILNQGTLALNGVTVTDNSAVGSGSVFTHWRRGITWHVGGGWGGGIYSSGSLTMQSVVLSSNTAVGGSSGEGPGGTAYGGGVYVASGTATMDNVTLSSNVAQGGDARKGNYWGGGASGGAVYVSSGTITMTGVTLSSNTAVGGAGSGGGMYSAGGSASGGGMCVASGTATLIGTTVSGNSAQGGAAGRGAPKNGRPGTGSGGGLYIDSTASVSLDAFTVAHTTGNTPDDILGSYTLST